MGLLENQLKFGNQIVTFKSKEAASKFTDCVNNGNFETCVIEFANEIESTEAEDSESANPSDELAVISQGPADENQLDEPASSEQSLPTPESIESTDATKKIALDSFSTLASAIKDRIPPASVPKEIVPKGTVIKKGI